jgi:hypothetical protein
VVGLSKVNIRFGSYTISLGIAAASVVVAIASFFVVTLTRSFDQSLRPATPSSPIESPSPIPSASTLEEQVTTLTHRLDALSQPTTATQLSAQMAAVSTTVADLKNRLSGLEAAIVISPEKALQIPLLRKDLDDFRNQNNSAMSTLDQNIGRQYDLMKWVLGTFALGLGGLVFSVYKSGKAAK